MAARSLDVELEAELRLVRHADGVVALCDFRELEEASFPHIREASLEFGTALTKVTLGKVGVHDDERLVELVEILDADIADAHVRHTRGEELFQELFLILDIAAKELVADGACELALELHGIAEFAFAVSADEQVVLNGDLVFLIVFENRRCYHVALVAVNYEGDFAFHVERNRAIVARLVGRINPAFANLPLLRDVEDHVVELLDGRQVRETFFCEVDGREVALHANGFEHVLEQKRHVLAVAAVFLESHFCGLRNQAVAAESHIAVADVLANKVDDRLDGIVANLVPAHFICLFANLDGLLELVADEVLVIVADIAPFLLASEYETSTEVAVYWHVKFLTDNDRVFDFPFDTALDRGLFERTVFFRDKACRVGVNAEDGFSDRHVAATFVVRVRNHALVFKIRTAELHVDKVTRS